MTLDKTRFRDAPVVAVSAKPSSSTDDLPENETGISRSGHQLKFLKLPFLCEKSPGRAFLFRSSQQLPRVRLAPL